MDVLAGVDVNSSALKTFSNNFPEAEAIEGSVGSKNILDRCEKLFAPYRDRRPTVIVSGPPCQGFSAAGSRDPSDPRNRVLVAVGRAISKLQPDYALVENVSMLLATKHDDRIQKFEEALVVGGFLVTSLLLDASEFGVAQKRKRAFFLVTRTALDPQEIINALEAHKSPSSGAKKALEGLPRAKVRPEDYDDNFENRGIYNHFAMRHSQRVRKKIQSIKPGTGPMSYRRLHPTRLSNTLFSGHRAPPAHFSQGRSITVREAARLQGFPDTFRIYGSFANQMEQVTNAVPPPLAGAVLSVLTEMGAVLACA
jgi:DNA (cytosine-5)-methyltransferase 1